VWRHATNLEGGSNNFEFDLNHVTPVATERCGCTAGPVRDRHDGGAFGRGEVLDNDVERSVSDASAGATAV
jgi:hypothetical protein